MKSNKATTIAAAIATALTLAVMTLPVIIASTKEALSAPAAIPVESEAMFNELKPSFTDDTRHWLIKAKWEANALPLFKSALNDYHSATKPLKKAVFDSKDFGPRSLRITLAKSGNIAVTSRHVHTAAK